MLKPHTRFYFPNLDGYRFIAAFIVWLSHSVDWALGYLKIDVGNTDFSYFASLAVTFFFVLSGFLITHLLLDEKEKSGTISIMDFYKRRIRRIMPLYYLIFILGFFVRPWMMNEPVWTPDSALFMHLLFLPNLSLILGFFPFTSHVWSVGVEEQFYLFWPWIMKFSKHVIRAVVVLFLCLVFMENLSAYGASHWFPENKFLSLFSKFMYMFRVPCMCMGALAAIGLRNRIPQFLHLVHSKIFQWIALLAVLCFFAFKVQIKYVNHECYSVLFAILITSAISTEHSIVNFERSWMKYLGKISYGLYMFQPFCAAICLYVLQQFVLNDVLKVVLFFPFSFIFLVLIASSSYKLMESPVIRMGKQRIQK